MEKKDTNTDYRKFVRLFFIQGVFKSHLKKIAPTQSANSHPKSQFDVSPSYMNVLKNAPHPPLITQGVGVRTMAAPQRSMKIKI